MTQTTPLDGIELSGTDDACFLPNHSVNAARGHGLAPDVHGDAGGAAGEPPVEHGHPGPDFSGYGDGWSVGAGSGRVSQAPSTRLGQITEPGYDPSVGVAESVYASNASYPPPGEFAEPVPAAVAPASQYAPYPSAPTPPSSPGPATRATPTALIETRLPTLRLVTRQWTLGVVLTILGSIGCLVMVIESIGIVGMSTSGVDVPAALILSTVFISALALGTLTGGIVAMRSSRALTFLLSVASGDRPQQGLSRPVRSGRKGSKRYSPQFKADAVQMVVTSTKTVAEVARSLGANPSTLGKWVARHRAEHSDHRVQRQG